MAPTVAQHFDGRDPAVAAIYSRLLAAARALGPVAEDPWMRAAYERVSVQSPSRNHSPGMSR